MLEFNGMSCICDECPMIWGIERQIDLSDKYGTEFKLEYCGCDKTGDGKFYVYGFCEDAFIERPTAIAKGKRRTGRAYRRYQRKLKDARRKDIIRGAGYNPTVGYIEYDYVDGVWMEVGNHIKYPRNSNAQRLLKRLSNKQVRKYTGIIPKGNSYRKIFDYWWELY